QEKYYPQPARRKMPALPEPGKRKDRREINHESEKEGTRRHVGRDKRRTRDQLVEDRIIPLGARRHLLGGARPDQVLQKSRQAIPLRQRRAAHVESEIN